MLAEAGAKVAVLDVKTAEHPTLKKLNTNRAAILSLTADITNKKAVDAAFKKIVKTFGDAPTILINNAGLSTHTSASAEENGPFEKYPETVWDAMLDSHLKGMLLVSQTFIREYRKAGKKEGSIINLSSIYGVVSPPQDLYEFRRAHGEAYYKPVGYSVAKSGVLGFTKWLAEYCGYEKTGIRVNALVPGGVEAGQDAAFLRAYEKRTMLGRMAHRSDFSGAIMFLASRASSYMTGATLVIDGGWTAR